MSLIGLKERYFLGQERSYRFRLLSLCIECRLFMQLKLSPTVYCVLMSTSFLHMTSESILKCSRGLSPARALKINMRIYCVTCYTLHHTFPSCFPIWEEPTSQRHPNPLSLLQNSLQELSACVKLWLQPFLHWCLSVKAGLIGWDTLIIRARL